MFWSRVLTALNLIGLLFGLIGGLLLFFSLTLKPSNYRLVEKNDHGVAICLDHKLVMSGNGGAIIVSDAPCPQGIGPSRTPVIEAEKPAFVPWGLGLICVGFALQLPTATVAFFTKRPKLSRTHYQFPARSA
jgi:hypothetical protein